MDVLLNLLSLAGSVLYVYFLLAKFKNPILLKIRAFLFGGLSVMLYFGVVLAVFACFMRGMVNMLGVAGLFVVFAAKMGEQSKADFQASKTTPPALPKKDEEKK